MKNWFLLTILTAVSCFAQIPFHRGVNFSGWFQESSANSIQFTAFTKQDFVNAKSLGCDVIRLPIDLQYMTDGEPDYNLNPLFLSFLSHVLDWAEETEMYLILDNHTFNGEADSNEKYSQILITMWQQMAEYCMDRSDYIIYEIQNEPHGIDDEVWNTMQQQVVTALREIDQKHSIIIGPPNWNNYNNLQYMPEYEGDNLIYTFHFYDPYIFTHQGASWTDAEALSGIPFPYDAARMPQCPDELADTWIKGAMEYSYPREGNAEYIQSVLDIAIDFATERNVNVFCGEFGVHMPFVENQDRINWYEVVADYLHEHNVPWTMWDYFGSFGIFNQDGGDDFNRDLNVELCKVLSFTPPEQLDPEDPSGIGPIDIYIDYLSEDISDVSNTNNGLTFYSEADPASGKYCILWPNPGRYQTIGFDFDPDKDLSQLFEDGYALDFYIRGESAEDVQIDVRFVDTKISEEDHPWRIFTHVSEEVAYWDGNWNHLQVPLSEFTEHGAWDGAWFNPIGAFDWSDVNRLEIVSEYASYDSLDLYFDNIRIVDPLVSSVAHEKHVPDTFSLQQNYPNPFNPSTTISFYLKQQQHIKLSVYNIKGEKVATLMDAEKSAGQHQVVFNADKLSSGIYLYKLYSGSQTLVKSMLYVK